MSPHKKPFEFDDDKLCAKDGCLEIDGNEHFNLVKNGNTIKLETDAGCVVNKDGELVIGDCEEGDAEFELENNDPIDDTPPEDGSNYDDEEEEINNNKDEDLLEEPRGEIHRPERDKRPEIPRVKNQEGERQHRRNSKLLFTKESLSYRDQEIKREHNSHVHRVGNFATRAYYTYFPYRPGERQSQWAFHLLRHGVPVRFRSQV